MNNGNPAHKTGNPVHESRKARTDDRRFAHAHNGYRLAPPLTAEAPSCLLPLHHHHHLQLLNHLFRRCLRQSDSKIWKICPQTLISETIFACLLEPVVSDPQASSSTLVSTRLPHLLPLPPSPPPPPPPSPSVSILHSVPACSSTATPWRSRTSSGSVSRFHPRNNLNSQGSLYLQSPNTLIYSGLNFLLPLRPRPLPVPGSCDVHKPPGDTFLNQQYLCLVTSK